LSSFQDGQYFFDIFTTDGFLGDVPLVNFAYAPFMEVLPRKYRFRILNACMSRFIQLALTDPNGNAVPFQFIANDGNLVVNPITLTTLDQQGIAERYDIVVDFSRFPIGSRIKLVNRLTVRDDGRGPKDAPTLKGDPDDPLVGPVLEFRVVGQVQSVDVPGTINFASAPDLSQVPVALTEQIPRRHSGQDKAHRVRDRAKVIRTRPMDNASPIAPRPQPSLDHQDQWPVCALDECQPNFIAHPQDRRNQALDVSQRRRRLGSSDPSAL
jgi:FtsP/CotA-like multicopper oxidase with cupredoxin domain